MPPLLPPRAAASSPPPRPGDAAGAAHLPLLLLPPAGAVGTEAGPRRGAALRRGRLRWQGGRLPDLQAGGREGEREGEGEAQHFGRAVCKGRGRGRETGREAEASSSSLHPHLTPHPSTFPSSPRILPLPGGRILSRSSALPASARSCDRSCAPRSSWGVSASAQDSSTSCDCSPRNASLEPAGQEAINRAQRMRSRAYLFPPPCLYSRIHPPTHPHTCPLCLDDDAVQQVKQLGHDSRRHPLVDEEGVEEALAEQAALQLRGRRKRRRGHKVGGIPLTR